MKVQVLVTFEICKADGNEEDSALPKMEEILEALNEIDDRGAPFVSLGLTEDGTQEWDLHARNYEEVK